ncbi:MAG TPA: A/G-specific adenine glycosylase [Candidatus Paceibacterota bacterium]|nr:A/G-specific adenine glycosylase [Candidatus Paceibacterota bacterium]
MTATKFKEIIWKYYKEHGRYNLAWRNLPADEAGTKDPYKILVSEVMLQQTQVARVKTKYEEFLKKFPTVKMLARASTKDVLKVWQGLGYNRRALYLKKAAEISQRDFGGIFPPNREQLEKLPGIGQSTSGALMAFAFNIPVTFIETNIRSVYIHHFGNELLRRSASSPHKSATEGINDKDIIAMIEKHMRKDKRIYGNPRCWYYALMDYGVYLKENHTNPSRKSIGYKKQSSFKGSRRELRAKILRLFLKKPLTEKEIIKIFTPATYNISEILQKLTKEGFLKNKNGRFSAR